MKNLALIAMGLCLFSCSENKTAETSETKPNTASNASYSIDGKKVKVYTTAENTANRLTATDSALGFSDFGQPKETQVCIFADPSKTYQVLLGIGGAITDASAETFGKLPKEKQQELLQAYYDPQKGLVIHWQERIFTAAIFRAAAILMLQTTILR